ncbi:MAG TPA: hypothetical protein VFG30_08360 [Polyangiales bacterium]|nr:hypothetical protein [Polyangiales bacterium]
MPAWAEQDAGLKSESKSELSGAAQRAAAGSLSIATLRERHWGQKICTLGPRASDSAVTAAALTDNLELLPSFPEAMRSAHENAQVALMCCGYVADETLHDEHTGASNWVGLHFEYYGRMVCYEVFVVPIMPMCLARKKKARGNTLVLHPATRRLLQRPEFAQHFEGPMQIHTVPSKPCGVQATARGQFDYCVGSLPNVQAHPELEVLQTIEPNMIWALYRRTVG